MMHRIQILLCIFLIIFILLLPACTEYTPYVDNSSKSPYLLSKISEDLNRLIPGDYYAVDYEEEFTETGCIVTIYMEKAIIPGQQYLDEDQIAYIKEMENNNE